MSSVPSSTLLSPPTPARASASASASASSSSSSSSSSASASASASASSSSSSSSAKVPAPAMAPLMENSVPLESQSFGFDTHHLILTLNLLMTIVLLVLLFFLGRRRRSVRGGCIFKNATKICYMLVPIYITYIMGALHKDPNPHVLSPVWASALVYAYGGVVTITACDLRDNDETLRYLWNVLPLFFWTIWMGYLIFKEMIMSKYLPALVFVHLFFLLSAMINTRQTLEAFYRASKSKGLPHAVEPMVHYVNQMSHKGHKVDPRSMSGYEYVVWGNLSSGQDESIPIGFRDARKVITVDEIWKWVSTSNEKDSSELGRKEQFLEKCPGKDRLKDVCLSYALFRVILTRFAGFHAIHKINHDFERTFLQEGLLSEEPQRVERAFRIVEDELDFLFDFLYTKAHVCGSYRFRDSWPHLGQILFLVLFATFGIPFLLGSQYNPYVMKSVEAYDIYKYERDEPIKYITMLVILIFAILECCKFIMVQFSKRKIVWLLCTGIREVKSNDKWASITELRTTLIWSIKHFLMNKCHLVFFYFFKPWQRKLGQYSFLESYGQVPLFARKLFSPLGKVVNLSRDGQCRDSLVSLSMEVKQAIVSSLLQYQGLELLRGTHTMERYGLTEISDKYGRSLDNDALFILVWHIATGFYESNHPVQTKTNPDHKDFLAATQLSKYCAYLLVFAAEFLPGHRCTTERLFDKAVKQAQALKLNGHDVHDLYNQLISRVDSNDIIVVKGAFLAKDLAKDVIERPKSRWKVLAEFWAEVLLYLAPSDDVGVHGEYLARGGEFITHLWALLTHGGVFKRESLSCMV